MAKSGIYIKLLMQKLSTGVYAYPSFSRAMRTSRSRTWVKNCSETLDCTNAFKQGM